MAHDLQINELLNIFDDYELEIIKQYNKGLQLGILPNNDPIAWQKYQLDHLATMDKKLKYISFLYGQEIKNKTQKTILEIYAEAEKKEIKRMVNKLNLQNRFPGAVFGEMNYRAMASTISAINNDINNAIYSVYRQSKDDYRQIIQQSAILKQTGTKTLTECIDIAQSDFLADGIAYITYKNGARVNIRSYAEMALRTNSQRAMIQGQGTARNRLGIFTVRISSHGLTCEKCAPYQGMVMIDDVYANGVPDGKHPLLSEAVANGFLHPNCRHNLMTIDTDIDDDNTTPYQYTQQDEEKYLNEQEQRRLEREIRKAKREATGFVNQGNSIRANATVRAKQKQLRDFLQNKPYLQRQYNREKI